jgi:3-oxoacid CoA-transferase subunit A
MFIHNTKKHGANMPQEINADFLFNEDARVFLIGGFGGVGVPMKLIEMLAAANSKNHTIITNDTGTKESGIYPLLKKGKVAKLICSFVGQNREAEAYLSKIELIFLPQGSLAESIRAGASKIKYFSEKILNKYKITESIDADYAFVKASKADIYGNLFFDGTNRNFNPVMLTAGKETLVEVDEYPVTLKLHERMMPGIYVDYLLTR